MKEEIKDEALDDVTGGWGKTTQLPICGKCSEERGMNVYMTNFRNGRYYCGTCGSSSGGLTPQKM